METVTIIPLHDSATSVFKQQYSGSYWSELAAVETAEDNHWTGFGFVTSADGSPLPWQDASDNHYGHFCTFAADKSNWETITQELEKITKEGVEYYEGCVEFEGKIAYDSGNPAVLEMVESYERSLSDYHILDESRVSELEYENAIEVLENCYTIPDDVDVSDVLSALHDKGYSDCPECNSWDVDGVLDEMGWRECADCSEILETSIEGALCENCARYTSVNPDCDHTILLIETSTHNGTFVTETEVHDSDAACEDCYRELYPYGRDN